MTPFIPSGRRILVKRIETPDKVGSLFIPEIAREKSLQAKVVALGTGRDSEGKEVDGTFSVKAGDTIYIPKHSGWDIVIDGEVHTILDASEVLGIFP